MTSAARQPAAIEITAAKFCQHIAAVENKKPTGSNKSTLSQSAAFKAERQHSDEETGQQGRRFWHSETVPSKAQCLVARLSTKPKMEKQGMETLLFRSSYGTGLHIVQRAAPPAREPCPVAVDVVARAVMPTCVEQPMSVATTGLSAFGLVFFCAGATFFARLLACFFVRHNLLSFLLLSFSASPPHHSV